MADNHPGWLSVKKREKKGESKPLEKEEEQEKEQKKEKVLKTGYQVVKTGYQHQPGEARKKEGGGEKTGGTEEITEVAEGGVENGEFETIELPPWEIVTGEQMSPFYFKFQFRNVEYSSGRNKTLLCYRVETPEGTTDPLQGYMEDEHATTHVEEAFFTRVYPRTNSVTQIPPLGVPSYQLFDSDSPSRCTLVYPPTNSDSDISDSPLGVPSYQLFDSDSPSRCTLVYPRTNSVYPRTNSDSDSPSRCTLLPTLTQILPLGVPSYQLCDSDSPSSDSDSPSRCTLLPTLTQILPLGVPSYQLCDSDSPSRCTLVYPPTNSVTQILPLGTVLNSDSDSPSRCTLVYPRTNSDSDSPLLTHRSSPLGVLRLRKNLRLYLLMSRLFLWEEPEIKVGLRCLASLGVRIRMMKPPDFLSVWETFVEKEEDMTFNPWEDCQDNYQYYQYRLNIILK
ncbi:uncharacterized protein LOC112240686 [Oncorhynchus tshawytscha]|uniref:uncharacterized protein LOC112240686 n=1 Tax=Oncorhynchus tshawytscha TaxID=74940 RepID=UPI001C3DDFB4|nr:uncharacterized protein LOC112240686 [Oncorhynchus tshawytscha]